MKKPVLLILVAVILSTFQTNAAGARDKKNAKNDSNSNAVAATISTADLLQQIAVTGTVKDENGQGMPGVNIRVEGTTLGTMTDINGKYSLSVPNANSTLIFSFIGYSELKVPVAGKSVIDASLQPSTESLEEVVVVGYGTQKKKDLASAITVVSTEEIVKQPVANVEIALQGLAAGVQVTAGRNGASDVVIRGLGTTSGNNSPLYVIDGIPSSSSNVNPSDIETIQVLKDAASAAIYGSRGSNGVVVITTKTGKSTVSGQPKVSLRSYYGTEKAWKLLDLTNTEQWAQIVYDGNMAAGQAPPALATWIVEQKDGKYAGPETDWQDEIFQTGVIKETGIDISGGSEAGNYFFSAEQYNQEGILITTPNKRYSLRMNSNWKSNKFTFGENISFTYTDRRSEQTPDGRTAFQQAMNMTPNIPVYDERNQPGGYAGAGWTNSEYSPFASGHDAANVVAFLNRVKNMNYTRRFMGSAYGEYKIIDGLTFRSTFGFVSSETNGRNLTLETRMGSKELPNTTLNENDGWGYDWNWDQTLNYNKRIDKHDFNLMVTYSSEYSKDHNFNAGGQTIQTEVHDVLGKVESNFSLGGSENETSRISQLGRLTYSYAGKYILVANVRRDGSSKFSEGNKWGTFPSASLAWNISEESFMDGLKAAAQLSRMKLRGSFGYVGNDRPIGAYSYVPSLSSSPYSDGTVGLSGQTVSNLTKNPALRWEASQQLDLGVELGFFKSALSVEVDFYNKLTKDMLVGVPVPGSSGVGSFQTTIMRNIGSILNRGWEFQATYRKATGDFHYSIGGNLTTNYNEVLDFAGQNMGAGGTEFGTSTRTEAGHPIGAFYAYKTLGIFQNQAEIDAYVDVNGAKIQPLAAPGDIKFYKKPNAEGDLVGPISATDQVWIGDPAPDFTYGINMSADYKGLDLTVFFQGVQGNDLMGMLLAWTQGMHNNFNLGTDALKRWKQEGDITDVPRAVRGDPNNNVKNVSDRYLFDGSYLRLKNLTLGYTLPKSLVNKVKISNVRVYATGRNLLTLTSYPFYDPEIGSGGGGMGASGNSSTARGIDQGYYPQARTLLMGIQVDF
ncbi:MAG TPA: TonB-dependent receptor [Bacteroidales bacterium]|nr:TonB-dependent receptor [Bacteroidales bacterium]